jgi:branched-chain amino acid transport system permease protein
MFGALTAWTVAGLLQPSGLPGWVILIAAAVVACSVSAALNFSIEKIAYRPCAIHRAWPR